MNIGKKLISVGLFYLSQNNVQLVQSFTTIKPSVSAQKPLSSKFDDCVVSNSIDGNTDKRINVNHKASVTPSIMSALLSLNILLATTSSLPIATPAEEYEAPTLFTGESTEICVKRGPLGACLKTEIRTAENDNDKATQYFSKVVKSENLKENSYENNESDLIIKLRQQTEDNKEKNARIVRQKTMMNDVSASFGPFDKQVVILNTDGETFTLLSNPQAMRLKEQGYISKNEKKFIKQPSQEVLDATLNPPEGEGGFFGGLLKGVLGSDE